MNKKTKISILVFTVLFVLISSYAILISSLNTTLDNNSIKLKALISQMKIKEKELLTNLKEKKNLTIVVNSQIVSLDFKNMELIEDNSEPEFILESEKILAEFWFLKNAKTFLATVKELKNFSKNMYLISHDIDKQGQKLSLAGLLATISHHREYEMEEILINPFFNIKISADNLL